MSGEVTSRIVVVGMSVRVPGADGVRAFEEMLFAGRTGYVDLPSDRCDRLLYFDPAKGKTGKTYTTLGGVVPERPVNQDICPLPTETQRLYDAAHVQFAEVAATAWMDAGLQANDGRLQRTGVYVGHSGGTKSGGGLSLGTQIEEALSFVDDLDSFRQLPKDARRAVIDQVIAAIRQSRPVRQVGSIPNFHAYQAASLAARVLGLTGPRSVIDAACASSLVAMHQAMMAIRAGRIDSAIVGGATYNNVDNLILFSHSQACTATDSRPFDDGASGLVSSEGYVAVVITTEDIAEQHGLPILGVIRGVGMASDGKGRSLWAPRLEGQVLALQRAYFASGELEVLDIDYMEAHATSTQLGDATELETLRHLADRSPSFQRRRARSQGLADRLLLGSVKSNIGHTLEAAGLIGLVKVLLSMHRNQVAPSLRFENPNRNYDWSTSPVRVVTQPEAWPTLAADSRPKRAAVSAFGIGGLNAHVVVEAYEGSVRRPARTDAAFRSPLSSDPIAIVGRGLVVAGAKNVAEFVSLMQSDQSAIVDAPADRWRNRAGVETHHGPTSHKSPHCRGGFVTEFVFDGAKYRIPPKQVQQANPVQMMLIDAVSQALADVNSSGSNGNSGVSSSSEHWPFDRQRVGVVIGTIFGGEFGDQLQVGMRLPEICEQMIAAMLRRGVSAEKAQSIADDYRCIVLKNRPALLDETGSFTASTLASRVAKTFDLMGGAAALDSDDSSGLAALMVAVDQLKTGSLDMILCGSAQRSMSLAAYEALDMTGRLVRSGRIEDIADDCRQIIPGEGVVTLMLCRLSDAQRLGLPIYGVLDDVHQATLSVEKIGTGTSHGDMSGAFSNRPLGASPILSQLPGEVLNAADAEIVRRIGYLAGAHSLIRLVAESFRPSGDSIVAAKTNDGIVLQTTLQTSRRRIRQNSMSLRDPNSDESGYKRSPNSDESGYGSGGAANREPPPIGDVAPLIKTQYTSSKPTPLTSATMDFATTDQRLRTIRFAATTVSELKQLLAETQQQPAAAFADSRIVRSANAAARSSARSQFVIDDRYRAAIVASNANQLRDRITVALKTLDAGKTRTVVDRDRVVLWQSQENAARVAWLFPGQGSHYAEAPTVFAANEHAREMLAAVDDAYAANNLPRLSSAFGNPSIKPGEDVWWAQAWVLGASAALIAVLKSEGLRPDAVLGHSFGEFTASLAANVTTLSQTIELARHRANAVMSHMRTPGGLLSVRAAVHEVDTILKSAALPVYVTHLNSPKQTVIAGSRDGIAAAKALLDRQSLAAMSIPVPAPFHTPMLADAEVAFERMSSSVPMRPPVCGFMSATCVQYLAEPSGVRHSLVRQLTQPVMYLPSIQRMMGEGFRVFLEVGPNDVLTRMNRDIVDSQALCLSLDVPGQPFDERMALVHAAIECVTGSGCSGRETRSTVTASTSTIAPVQPVVAANDASLFDVTRSRRVKKADVAPVAETQASSVVAASVVASSVMASLSTPQPETTSIQPLRNVVEPVKTAAVVASTAPAVSEEQLRMFTRDLVVELTGYSPDIIDFEADLEADLGIDSIKKAQVLGELGEWLGLTVRPDSLRLDSVKSLDDAVRVAMRLASEQGVATSQDVGRTEQREFRQSVDVAVAADHRAGAGTHFVRSGLQEDSQPTIITLPSDEKLDALLIDYVVDQTGYSRDIVDVDADLEADLGLDSIKLAQLIGEMREQFNLESLTLESIAQARFRTLRGIREFLIQQAGGRAANETTRELPSFNGKPQATAHYGSSSEVISQGQSMPNAGAYGLPLNEGNGIQRSSAGESTAIRGITAVRELPVSVLKPLANNHPDHAFIAAKTLGEQHRTEIRAALRSAVYHQVTTNRTARDGSRNYHGNDANHASEVAHVNGLAVGAGVAHESIARTVGRSVSDGLSALPTIEPAAAISREIAAESSYPAPTGTHRFALRVLPAPRRAGMPLVPELHGAALILGSNVLAETLLERVRELGQQAFVINTELPIDQIEKTLERIWQTSSTPHLFLTMAFDASSIKSLSENAWLDRRPAALEAPFRICQLWMTRTIDANHMEDASVIAVTQLGGDFGFSGRHVTSIEAIGGLVKAMLIEAWMRGFRTTPMKVIDVASTMTVPEVASGVLQEIAVPSYDMEIAFRPSMKADEPERMSVQAMAAPLGSGASRPASVVQQLAKSMSADRQSGDRQAVANGNARRITRGGTWIVTGGGRGITAVIAMTLAKKYDLTLHLLGTAPVPHLSDDFVARVAVDRSGVRRQIMQDASARGENPVEAWRNTEKAIEVDATLRDCRRAQKIRAVYHCCDVADFEDVERTIAEVRRQAGPIRGVIHGAGAGQDSWFDRKRPDKVEKCLKAKIDGSLAVMQATKSDPLEWFVAFGSISGRFGANGHTDYSLANDMMAKIVDRYRMERPDVRSVTFHWHAWGDIGMATKPEAKLALEMIDMEFMPAADGIAHFMRELELGGDEPEVLITDESYFRKFFPAERLSLSADDASADSAKSQTLPLLSSTVVKHDERVCSSVVTLNPLTDKFLSQHRVQGRATLPFVVAIELMAEAIRARLGVHHTGVCLNARAAQAIRFSTDDPLAVTVQSTVADDGTIECRLLADVRRRDGRMVEEDREYFRATFDPRVRAMSTETRSFEKPTGLTWKRIEYVSPEGLIYHGPELQELREIADDGQYIWGRIAASAPVQLFGGARARGFSVACATMDACLYAIGYAAWQRHQKPSLPVRFDRIEIGRLPDPGEPCLVRIHEVSASDNGAVWNFELQGHNGDRLLTVSGYRIGWLK